MQRIAIPTEDGRFLAHFGRAPTMAVFSIEDGRVTGREDRANPDPEHLDRAHHKIMMDLVKDCEVVIASHMGPPMVTSLTRVGKRVLGAPSESVERTLQAYLRSLSGGPALEELTAEATGEGHEHH